MANLLGGISVEISGSADKLWAAMADTAARAGQEGQRLGELIGQSVTQGVRRSVAPIPSIIFPQGRTAAPIPGITWPSGPQNMATNLGLGGQFIFAVQDASSAIGQFGTTVTGLRFAILGAANNIQILVMQAALAGVGFRGLREAITPLHVGLAIFSAGISLLPLLLAKTNKAIDEHKNKLRELFNEYKAFLDQQREVAALSPPQKFPESRESTLRAGLAQAVSIESRESPRVNVIGRLLEASRAELAATQQAIAAMGPPILLSKSALQERGALLDKEIGLNKRINELIGELRESERRVTEARTNRLNIEQALTKELERQRIAKQQEEFDKATEEAPLRAWRARRQLQEEAAKDAAEQAKDAARRQEEGLRGLREARDRPLRIRQMELELQRMRMPEQGRFAFTSPENLIQSIQSSIGTDADKQIANQEKQIQLQQKQNELTDELVNTIASGTLWGGWVP